MLKILLVVHLLFVPKNIFLLYLLSQFGLNTMTCHDQSQFTVQINTDCWFDLLVPLYSVYDFCVRCCRDMALPQGTIKFWWLRTKDKRFKIKISKSKIVVVSFEQVSTLISTDNFFKIVSHNSIKTIYLQNI